MGFPNAMKWPKNTINARKQRTVSIRKYGRSLKDGMAAHSSNFAWKFHGKSWQSYLWGHEESDATEAT